MKIFKKVDEDGTINYLHKNGQYHRENGPAIIRNYGTVCETKSWWINGKRHREDGPALVYSGGEIEYWLNNKKYTKEDWEEEIIKLKLTRIKDL